jgi:hypothetical protein
LTGFCEQYSKYVVSQLGLRGVANQLTVVPRKVTHTSLAVKYPQMSTFG